MVAAAADVTAAAAAVLCVSLPCVLACVLVIK